MGVEQVIRFYPSHLLRSGLNVNKASMRSAIEVGESQEPLAAGGEAA